MEFDPSQTLINVRLAATDDLLCRVTVERSGMEPEAVALAEIELESRGVTSQQQAAFQSDHADCLKDAAGLPFRCDKCLLPAHVETWGWHRVWSKIPLFPRKHRLCKNHEPAASVMKNQ